jgi:hypothetical protein
MRFRNAIFATTAAIALAAFAAPAVQAQSTGTSEQVTGEVRFLSSIQATVDQNMDWGRWSWDKFGDNINDNVFLNLGCDGSTSTMAQAGTASLVSGTPQAGKIAITASPGQTLEAVLSVASQPSDSNVEYSLRTSTSNSAAAVFSQSQTTCAAPDSENSGHRTYTTTVPSNGDTNLWLGGQMTVGTEADTTVPHTATIAVDLSYQ